MFSSFTTRDRLRRSMSSRSIRKTPRPVVGIVDPNVAKAHAAAAASKAMRSGEGSYPVSGNSYDRLGGPTQMAVPRRRPNCSLQGIDDGFSVSSAPAYPPVTPRQSMESGSRPCIAESTLPPPHTDFRGLDGRDSSVPSSFRRLRKAKSMFSTRQRFSNITYKASPKSPKSPRHGIDLERSPGFELPRTLRPSISFIHGGKLPGSRGVPHAKSHDVATQLARSQFLEDSGGSGPVRHPSFLSRNKREPKPFRKTFRVTSDAGIGAFSPEQANFERSRNKSRIFSASFKKGLKRVFGLSKPVEQKLHLHDQNISIPVEKLAVKALPVSITADQGVSLKPTNETDQLKPTQVSSGRDSICSSASRVTSWADTTAANTVATRKTGHRQSLSSIEEHGDLDQPLPRMSDQVGSGYNSPSKRSSAHNLDPWVNSHDLYAALIKQIGQKLVSSPEEEITFGTVPGHSVIPERTTSIYSHRSRQSVRHVASGDSSPVSFATAHRGDSQSPWRQPQSKRNVRPSHVSRYLPGEENRRPLSPHAVDKTPQSAFIIDEHSDESTGSIVITNSEDMQNVSRSSSVYSRSSRGRTLTEDIMTDDDQSLGTFEEPGTVTIFPSQRHISPTRKPRSNPPGSQVQASADWQQWMNSQIGRIETTTPTREHFREDAQYQEDDDELFMGMIRRAQGPSPDSTVTPYVEGPNEPARIEAQVPIDLKVLAQNNFSRPFSRSTSVRTIVSSQKIEPSFAEIEYNNPSDAYINANQAEDTVPRLQNSRESSLSPMCVRAANLREAPDSPTPRRDAAGFQKRTWTLEQYPRYSARHPVTNGRPNSFRSMRTYRDFRGLNNENTRQQKEHDEMMGQYHKLQGNHSTVSSKHMVDIFLDSRRRPMDTAVPNQTANVFL
ncbi:uncharacterized protein N7477_007434 [Penicillium maclennaniae]|uniref:uncharacterized protein n=1 Tax=Penicillium maclennaniae TaxID=1343394 RepID=UPI002541162F|nr:uncharacterized protein N7477_007434 [Penicillium maclennaniae]KAJ5664986.1 hypothetical protein N7477_007434 [Penicillium maclennaniae]